MKKTKIDLPLDPVEKAEEAALEAAMHALLMEERDRLAQPLDEESERSLEESYERTFRQRMALIERETRHTHAKPGLPRAAYRALRVAAALVLALGLSLTIATASSSAFRSYLAGFFINVNERSADIGFSDEAISAEIPDSGPLSLYVGYITEGYEQVEYLSSFAGIEISYMNEHDKIIAASVNIRNTRILIDSEDCVISSVDINGNDATMFIKEGEATIVWQYGDLILEVWVQGTPEVALKVARSIYLTEY